MALMFQRLANNFAKNGYFPTDTETTARLLTALLPCEIGQMRILDPCAGEGVALAECKQHLDTKRAMTYGIEYNEERAWHAKSLLDYCIHGDMQNCVLGQRSFSLLFLNPPYGDLVSDKAQTGTAQKGRPRLEKLFYQRTIAALQWGGILVLIIPGYSLDKELSTWIANHFARVEVFLAPEQRFKQIVLFGIRKKTESLMETNIVKNRLLQIGQGMLPPELPSVWSQQPYVVPATMQATVKFFSTQLDAKQLADEIKRQPCLWQKFQSHFGNAVMPSRRPLMDLSQWHLALSLAAGQVAGVVTAKDGRTFLIKGDTYKEVNVNKACEVTEDGNVTEVTTRLDKFVPVIRAVDMTESSNTYGQILTIR